MRRLLAVRRNLHSSKSHQVKPEKVKASGIQLKYRTVTFRHRHILIIVDIGKTSATPELAGVSLTAARTCQKALDPASLPSVAPI